MENFSKKSRPSLIGTRTLVIVGIIIITLGLAASFFFSRTIEQFFWEARTKSVIGTVEELSKNLQGAELSRWQESDSQERLGTLAVSVKQYLPNISALKIFNNDGVLVWTDLRNVKAGYLEPGIEVELAEIAAAGHMVKAAGESTKTELSKTDLLEVWTVIRNTDGKIIGYTELYFDSSDIITFVSQIQYSIWGTIFIVLLVVVFLLRLTFRQQNDIIVRQAHELSDIVEQSPVGIYTIDQKGVVISMNPKMLKLIGEENIGEILNKSIFETEHVKNSGIGTLIRESLTGVPFDKEIKEVSTNGDTLYRHYRGTPLFTDDRKTVTQVLFTVEDISERKKLEAELALHTKSLEESVTERTKNLQEKIDELEQFQRLTVGREIRMTELKQEIEKMRIKLESLGVKTNTI